MEEHLSKIEALTIGKKFVEHTEDEYATTFTITLFELMKRYEFDMDNENMHSHWVGLFSYDILLDYISGDDDRVDCRDGRRAAKRLHSGY